MKTYGDLSVESRKLGHNNKCVVIALSVIFDLDYDVAYQQINDNCSRKVSSHSGYFMNEYNPVYRRHARRLNARFLMLPRQVVRQYAKTTKSLTRSVLERLNIKTGYVSSNGHISAIKNGKVEDWAEHRAKRIEALYVLIGNDDSWAVNTVEPKRSTIRDTQQRIHEMLVNNDGMTIVEIAEQLNVAEATVRTKLSRLRKLGVKVDRRPNTNYYRILSS